MTKLYSNHSLSREQVTHDVYFIQDDARWSYHGSQLKKTEAGLTSIYPTVNTPPLTIQSKELILFEVVGTYYSFFSQNPITIRPLGDDQFLLLLNDQWVEFDHNTGKIQWMDI